MKFTNIIKGKNAERAVEVPGYADAEGKPFTIIFRPLTGLEHESAFAAARSRAIEKGVTEPKIGEPIYDLALMAFILAVGCVDPDSPEGNRSPSFDSGIQVLERMQPETIVYLHEHHEAWQDECSPYSHKIDGSNLLDKVREVASPEGYAIFMRFSPSMRLNFSISMARLLSSLLEANSTSGSVFVTNSKKLENETKPLSSD